MSWKKNLAVGFTLAGAAAATIHLINKVIYFSATLDNLLSNPSGSYYEWKFGKIYYTKQGKGKPLLLIHDLSPYSSSSEWSKLSKILSETNTVYTIDLLGCGRSDKPNLTHTNYLYVQLITDFIKHVIGKTTDVIATGDSGSFVLGSCQNDKGIIDKIGLVNPKDVKSLSRIPGKKSKTLTKLILLPVVGTFLYNLLTKRKNIKTLFQKEYFYDHTKIEESIVKTYYESAHSSNASSKYLFASLAGNYLTSTITHYLDSLNNSIFLFIGSGYANGHGIAEEYKKILPAIEVIKINNSKYLPQLECAASLAEQILILFES